MPEASSGAEEPTPPPLPRRTQNAVRASRPAPAIALPAVPPRGGGVKATPPPLSSGLLVGGALALAGVAFLAGFVVRGWLAPQHQQNNSQLVEAETRPRHEFALKYRELSPKVTHDRKNGAQTAVANQPHELPPTPTSTVEQPRFDSAVKPASTPLPEMATKPHTATEVRSATINMASSEATATPPASSPPSPLAKVVVAERDSLVPPLSTTPPTTASANATSQSVVAQTLYQQIDIARQPKFEILGAVTVQDLRYKLLSELKVQPPDGEGRFKVDQVVLSATLVKADDLSRSIYEASLQALKGWQFSFVLNRQREVVEWSAGPSDERKVAKVKPAKTDGFLLTSVLDQDGWKEVAQLTFFVPTELKSSKKQSWTRRFTHDFRPLGSWYGETRFEPRSENEGVARIGYAHHLHYLPPGKEASAEGPLVIESAKFQCHKAEGELYYDQAQRRVQAAQEVFNVNGFVATSIAGQSIRVAVEEQQSLAIRIFDQKPSEDD